MSAPKHNQKRAAKVPALVTALLPWFAQNARNLPWRHTRDPYAIHVSEIMLQQTQVKTVVSFWERWMRELPTIKTAAQAPSDKIYKLWEGLGYYTRVRNLQKAAQIIVEKHAGKFPEQFDEVLALPGIGRYTAGAICSIAFNQPTPILDGNVIRVLARIFGIAENPKEKPITARLWQLAEELVVYASCLQHHSTKSGKKTKGAGDTVSQLNQSLMELGALVCTPRGPQCGVCPVKKLCVAFKENRAEDWPNLGKRPAATARQFVALVVESNGRFLVRQRPAGTVNAHLWEFPNVESAAVKPAVVEIFQSIFGVKPPEIHRLCTVKHSITRYRITLEAVRVNFGGTSSIGPRFNSIGSGTCGTRPSDSSGVWKAPAQMQKLAFTAAHKKLASAAVKSMLSGR